VSITCTEYRAGSRRAEGLGVCDDCPTAGRNSEGWVRESRGYVYRS
jgi:hypothetical protein